MTPCGPKIQDDRLSLKLPQSYATCPISSDQREIKVRGRHIRLGGKKVQTEKKRQEKKPDVAQFDVKFFDHYRPYLLLSFSGNTPHHQ